MLLESRADANSSGTSLVNILDVSDPASLVQVQNFTFTLDGPGTVPDRQEAPHPHQTVLDPTGAFLLVPDLGADLVRIFATSADGTVEMLDPLPVEPGSGPRHIAFAERDGTIMYLISELSNTISAWKVSYSEGTIEFEEMFIISTHGGCRKVPEGASASEILVSVSTSPSSNLALSGILVGGKRLIHLPSLTQPDGKFLTISSRNESAYTIPHPTSPDEDDIPSDTLVTFAIGEAGELTLVQKTASGGLGPRHFSFSEAGDLVAVGLQSDQRVVVMRRDVKTGKVGDIVAAVDVEGDVTCVVFDE